MLGTVGFRRWNYLFQASEQLVPMLGTKCATYWNEKESCRIVWLFGIIIVPLQAQIQGQ
jgi:hypothetical protein